MAPYDTINPKRNKLEVSAVRRCATFCILLYVVCVSACSQGVLGDVLTGNLIDPEPGQWSWYTLTDTQSNRKYALRQAVVAEETVGHKTGHWIEVEIIPEVGFPMLYKMLLTGPSSDPGNVHRIVMKEGENPPVEVQLDPGAGASEAESAGKRKSKGKETIQIAAGTIEAEHVVIESPGGALELWINDDVKPLGVVRMRGPHGEMDLRNYGKGGAEALSKLPLPEGGAAQPAPAKKSGVKVTTEIGEEGTSSPGSGTAKTNFKRKKKEE